MQEDSVVKCNRTEMATQSSECCLPVNKRVRELTVAKVRRQEKVARGPQCVTRTDSREGAVRS